MKTRRLNAAVAVTAAGVLALSACTSGAGEGDPTSAGGDASQETTETEGADGGTEGEGETSAEGGEEGGELESCLTDAGITETAEGEIFFSTGEDEWSGYNSITADTYSTYNSVIAGQMAAGFIYYGPDGTICQNEDFGTYEVTSEDPLTVEYTISDEATWSDGTPITINDYLMDWAAQNPEFLVPGYASGENPDAKPVFNHVSSSFPQYVPEGPEGEPGSKTFTVTYSTQYPDWELMIGSALPSHVVAAQIDMTGDELAQAILDRDADTVMKTVDFWNEGWLSEPGQLPDPAIAPSSGPYRLMADGWTAGQSITLEANPEYWGTPAATQRLTFRFAPADTHVSSLANGELNVIEPQATVDTISQLEALGESVTIETGSVLTWEHLDFNFNEYADWDEADGPKPEPSVFAESQGGLAAREAFALCVPRQAIVDTLIAPIAPDTEVMNAREIFPFQDGYEDTVSAAYDGRYDEVDLEAAKAKLEEAGLTEPIDVRIGYNAPNPRRTETVALIKASCDQAGFNIIDVSSDAFFTETLPNGAYDVALFAWAGSGQIASGQNIYGTGKPQNYGGYSNEAVDAAWTELTASLDEAVWAEQRDVIEKELWDTLFGIPLYAHPSVVAYSSNLENVRPTSTQDGVSWNAFQWKFAE